MSPGRKSNITEKMSWGYVYATTRINAIEGHVAGKNVTENANTSENTTAKNEA